MHHTKHFFFLISIFIFMVACSNGVLEAEGNENVEVERVIAKVEERIKLSEDAEKVGGTRFEFDDEIKIPITLKRFLNNYHEIADEDFTLPTVDGDIFDHSVYFGYNPTVSITFDDRTDNYTIRSVSCYKECTNEHQDIIIEALELDKFEYDKDYTIEEYYEENEEGEKYDVFKVEGK